MSDLGCSAIPEWFFQDYSFDQTSVSQDYNQDLIDASSQFYQRRNLLSSTGLLDGNFTNLIERNLLQEDQKVENQERQQEGQQGGGNQRKKKEFNRKPNKKNTKEKKQAQKEGDNINKMDQLDKPFGVYEGNEDNQLENHESNDMLYEKEKGQQRPDSQNKRKTSTQVSFTHQSEVQMQCQPPQVVNNEPKHQTQQSKMKNSQQKTELDKFYQRNYVEIQGNNNNKEKNIKKYYPSIFIKFSIKQAKGRINLESVFEQMLQRRRDKTKNNLSLSFAKPKGQKDDLVQQMIKMNLLNESDKQCVFRLPKNKDNIKLKKTKIQKFQRC